MAAPPGPGRPPPPPPPAAFVSILRYRLRAGRSRTSTRAGNITGKHHDFVLTRLARAVADARYSRTAVERRARLEIDGSGLEDGPAGLILHCFGMPGAEGREFVCTPDEHCAGFVVDTVSYVEGDLIRSGPLKGRRFEIAVPDSDP